MSDPLSPFASLEDHAAALSAGRATSAQLVELFLERIARLNPQLHAFTEVMAGPALERARQADRARAARPQVGPLFGMPVAVKDLIDVAGHATRAGSRATAATPAAVSAHVVQRLEAAGMIVLGKTHTVEFAYGSWGTNPNLGAPWNPWDLVVHRAPGGSSSGSGVAVAGGLVPAALGTDTGGSVRTPACFCGIVGLKTSRGLVGRGGVVPLALSLDTVGPMTRTVRDAALLLAAMAGLDPEDEATIGAPDPDPLAAIEQGVAGLRLGVLAEADRADLAPDIRALFDAALTTFEALGAELRPFAFPRPLAAYAEDTGAILRAEAYARLGALVDAPDSPISDLARARIGRGRGISAAAYLDVVERRRVDRIACAAAMASLDAVLAPYCRDVAPPLHEIDEAAMVSSCAHLVNDLDLCSLLLPIGLARGMPAGMQVIAPRFRDTMALRVGRAFEAARGCLTAAPPGL